ncbi:MAG: c-type cytochrome [Acidobacteriota bacterium]|nr:c-type cytochrome [Acidobacteriota bacterium]
MRWHRLLPGLLLLSGCGERADTGPLSPEESLASFQHPGDVRVEIFAAEPYVRDPVDLVFDEEGRAFVAEMLDYPYDPPPGEPPRSRIRVLEDRDGDGRVDHSLVFADGILQLKGLALWDGGVIASAAPDLLFFKDTDGDLRADERRVLFTGFEVGQPQGRVSNLRYSLDNWIYVSNDGHPGIVRSPERPGAGPVSVLGTDFRFRPGRGIFEAASGAARFGQTFDDWGHRFVTRTGTHVLHVLLPRRYLERNPYLAAPRDIIRDVSDHDGRIYSRTAPEKWRELRTRVRQERSDEMGLGRTRRVQGFFTGATGGTVYAGDRLPPPYRGNLFTGGVAGNLVHRDLLAPSGISFVASRAPEEQQREFLASTDPWFRPVQFTTGWDGNLYIVDIYRKLVEDPESIPEPIKRDLDFYAGTDRGRIYRVVPARASGPAPRKPALEGTDPQSLVRLLSHPNRWWRLTAQRLLVQRQEISVVAGLKDVVRRGESAKGRLHALNTLEGLSAVDSEILAPALRDSSPGVREHAVRMAEEFPELLPRLVDMAAGEEPRVGFQLALSLGRFQGEAVTRALSHLALHQSLTPGLRAAILSSEAGSSPDLLEHLLRSDFFGAENRKQRRDFLEELAAVAGARRRPAEIRRILEMVFRSSGLENEAWQRAGLDGLARGLEMGKAAGLDPAGIRAMFRKLLASDSERLRTAAVRVARYFRMPRLTARARRRALDPGLPHQHRMGAVRTLATVRFRDARPIFGHFLDSVSDSALRSEVLKVVGGYDDVEAAGLILPRWSTLSPRERRPALHSLIAHRGRASRLLDALERGTVETAALEQDHRVLLTQHPDETIRKRALNLYRPDTPDERDRVVRHYQKVLDLAADSSRGEQVFERECARCHQPQEGDAVGPDLRVGVQGHTREELLQAILNPNAQILGLFQNYIVTTREGLVYGGVLAAEGPGSLTLRSGPGEEETILRARIAEIRASQVSLMPEGLEENIGLQEMADLIAYIQAGDMLED